MNSIKIKLFGISGHLQRRHRIDQKSAHYHWRLIGEKMKEIKVKARDKERMKRRERT